MHPGTGERDPSSSAPRFALADRQRDVTKAGVPILSGIPIIGGLFGRHERHATQTELFVFLTPRVIRTDADLDAASDSVGDRTKNMRGKP